jgi:saccharopine dehydrogenase-like NADP-dependent oxidoreductase
VVVKGTKDGKRREYHFKGYSEGGKHSGLGVSTGVPAAAAAVLLARGRIPGKGVLSPEACIDPGDFFPLWEELTSAVTGKREPFQSIVDVVDEQGGTAQVSMDELLSIPKE